MRRRALPVLVLFTAAWVWFSVMATLRWAAAADPHAMTVGCDEASCCTSRCYLDEHGKHHCVPKEDSSCTCGMSSPENDSFSLPVLEAGTLPVPDRLNADLPAGDICSYPAPLHESELAVPTPPPRSGSPD